ncbi:WhiB family transcriptional regulator [Cellulomonas sp. zg-ZUI188]|uniref:WhiB family transcriptional regulator n=1 Tax=Cellulomonas fengjieae TaxID=2819978 RepID=A0ABS3SLL3_9CELL|nr:WhiB family transcriptional regulator [Cellulomonas fengjieae]QVI66518.1 WhiB family transcriptional regulator [Cellulomonas fengjieae]
MTRLVHSEGTDWQLPADCRDEDMAGSWDIDPDGSPSDAHRAALAACESCPVRQARLDFALAVEGAWPRWGIYGGTLPRTGSASPEHVSAEPTKTAVQADRAARSVAGESERAGRLATRVPFATNSGQRSRAKISGGVLSTRRACGGGAQDDAAVSPGHYPRPRCRA